MYPFTSRVEAAPGRLLLRSALSLAALSGAAAFTLFSPGLKDAAVAAANKALGLGMSLDAPWWVGFFPLALCAGAMLVAWRAWRAEVDGAGGKPYVAFRHHSLRNAAPPVLTAAAIPASLGRRTLSHVDCDLTGQLADGSPGNGDLRTAVEEQRRQVKRLLGSVRMLPDTATAYYGIAHVPLQVLAGRMFGPAVSPQLYELDADRATWRLLLGGRGPDLGVRRTAVGAAAPLADVAIRVSVSFEVGMDDVRQVVSGSFEDIHVRVASPARGCVTHLGQVDAICHEFRAALDSLHNRMAPGGKVHLFLAVPMSVGFSLGRVLSSSVNPDAICYNHVAQASPRYSWGLRVNTDVPSSRVIVRPAMPPANDASLL